MTQFWQSCIILTTEHSGFPPSISQPEWMAARRGMGWWMDGGMEGGWAQSSPPLALLRCHLLPHSRPEVVGVLLTCNPSHCLAAGSRVTCHSVWHESALTPADLSYFTQSVNTARVHGPLAKTKQKKPPKTTGWCLMTHKSLNMLRHVLFFVWYNSN